MGETGIWGGLYTFIDWAIQSKHYVGPRPTFECIDPDKLAPLPRDALWTSSLSRISRFDILPP